VTATPATLEPQTYLGLFTVESWREFKRHGGKVMGFNEKKAMTVARLQPGDRILCYLSKVSAFVAVLRVAGPSYMDRKEIWSDGVFPSRIPVEIELEAPLSSAVPIRTLAGKLSFLPSGTKGTGWTIYVRSSPRKWTRGDASAVTQALQKQIAGLPQKPSAGGTAKTSSPAAKASKRASLPETVRVGRIVKKMELMKATEPSEVLGSYEPVLSFNKVTGYSVNVPIAETCRPTAVCMKTCYFACGAASWSNALRHQRKVFNSIKADPEGFAERVALEYDRLGLSFIRWNGGGDLFSENVQAINHLAQIRPDIVIWLVTRIPEWAVQIEQAPNVFIHFSLDRHSLSRRADFLAKNPRSRNYFFSYQCDRDEKPPLKNLEHTAVMFFDSYKPTIPLKELPAPIVCPLNGSADITGTCEKCRRCFDGSAVEYASS
jgi:hypothetical protein